MTGLESCNHTLIGNLSIATTASYDVYRATQKMYQKAAYYVLNLIFKREFYYSHVVHMQP